MYLVWTVFPNTLSVQDLTPPSYKTNDIAICNSYITCVSLLRKTLMVFRLQHPILDFLLSIGHTTTTRTCHIALALSWQWFYSSQFRAALDKFLNVSTSHLIDDTGPKSWSWSDEGRTNTDVWRIAVYLNDRLVINNTESLVTILVVLHVFAKGHFSPKQSNLNLFYKTEVYQCAA